jgi:hypothetical protein
MSSNNNNHFVKVGKISDMNLNNIPISFTSSVNDVLFKRKVFLMTCRKEHYLDDFLLLLYTTRT